MRLLSVGKKKRLAPENVSHGEAAHSGQTPRPAGIPMVGGPHLDDDERKDGGVLRAVDREERINITLHSVLGEPKALWMNIKTDGGLLRVSSFSSDDKLCCFSHHYVILDVNVNLS